MAKKGTPPPRHAGKRPPAGRERTAPARRYSLDSILNEYREPATEDTTPPASSAPSKGEIATHGHHKDAAQAFTEGMRRELRQRGKKLPPPSPAPVHTHEEIPHRKTHTPPAESKAVGEDAPPLKAEEASPAKSAPKEKGKKINPFQPLYRWIVERRAIATIKKLAGDMDATLKEKAEREMPPKGAAKHYLSQFSPLFKRSRTALLLCIPALWIAFAFGGVLPIPGALGSDVQTATLVSLILLLTLMIIGLDVLTVGILSLAGKKPTWESLLAFACLYSVADCVAVFLTKSNSAPLPPCAVCCAGIALALRGNMYRCKSLYDSFLSLYRGREGVSIVSSVRLPQRKGLQMIRQNLSYTGFIHAAEDKDIVEKCGNFLAPILLCLVPLLALAAGFVGGNFSAVPHALAVLSVLSCAWTGLLSLPMLLSALAGSLKEKKAAVSGWEGVSLLGKCNGMVVTDFDLFPEKTMAFSSVQTSPHYNTEQIISRTGSLLYATGSSLSRLFADLMRKKEGRSVTVLVPTVENDGINGYIDGTMVHVGNASYMYKLGVKIDPLLLKDSSKSIIFTAYEKKLVGAFGIEYTASPPIAAALRTLQKNRRRPIFATEDFNIDNKLLERVFSIKADSFDFPSATEQGELKKIGGEKKHFPAAILTAGGVDVMTELFDASHYVYTCGRILQVLSIASAVLGLVLGFVFCLKGNWLLLSPTNLLLYLAIWLFPALIMSVLYEQRWAK